MKGRTHEEEAVPPTTVRQPEPHHKGRWCTSTWQ